MITSPRRLALRMLVALLAPALAACATGPALYEGTQAARRLDCRKYDEPERTRCVESTPASWAEYERSRRGEPR